MKFNINNNIFKNINYYLTKKSSKKCKRIPPSIIDNTSNRRIIVIGDIHGDFNALLESLYKARVINNNGNWIGKNTIVVQLGDQLDKAERYEKSSTGVENKNDYLDELKIIEYMYYLHVEAIKYNSDVLNLIGNHELMNVLGDFRYVSKSQLQGLGGPDIRKLLFRPGGPLAIKLACNTNGILQIGDWIFVHAGLLPRHIEHFTIPKINNIIRNILLGNIQIDDITPDIEDILFNEDSLLWTRFYSNDNLSTPYKCHILNKTLDILEIGENGGMVIGHTPKNSIIHACRKKLWMTDVKLSEAFGKKKHFTDRISVLEILNNGEQINIIT